MNFINKYLRNFKPYKLASHKIWNVDRDERKKILKLDWNESTISPSPLVHKKIRKLVDSDDFYNLYPSTYNDYLHSLISQYVQMPKENLQYFSGSDSLHEYIAKLFISPGDPVLLIWPSYDNFRLTAEVNGGNIHYFEFNQDFTFDNVKFQRALDEIHPSLVYICNPNNPTGFLHSHDFIEYLLDKYRETMFLIDEAYYEFSGSTCADLVNKFGNILVTRTMSKAFGIANFRFGYLIASKENINYISTIRNPKNITTFAQTAAEAVLEDIPYMERFVLEVKKARKYFYSALEDVGGVILYPSFGNFILIKFESPEIKSDFFQYLQNKSIYIRNVSQSRLLDCCLRVTIGTVSQMQIVVCYFKEYFNEQK